MTLLATHSYGSERKRVMDLCTFLEDQRTTWDEDAEVIQKYMVPRRGKLIKRGESLPGDARKRTRNIVDPSATLAMRILAAGMQGGLTPPNKAWLRLAHPDKSLMEWGPARIYLDDAANKVLWAFGKSNFYHMNHSGYTEMVSFGSSGLFMQEHRERIINFSMMPWGTFAWGLNAYAEVDTNVRRFYLTAKQLVEMFGEHRVSEKTRNLYGKTPYEYVECLYLVVPRGGRDVNRIDRLNMPWASYFLEAEASDSDGVDGFLWKGGFEQFPVLVSRWDVLAEEAYAYSPAHDMLPSVKLLQSMTRSQLMGIEKSINPPMRVPATFKKRVQHIPGGQTPVASASPESFAPLYNVQPDIAAISAKIEDVRSLIRQGFFNDLFLMFAHAQDKDLTATQVLEQAQEKMLILGPVIERQQSEKLDPAVIATFNTLRRRGIIGEPPPELAGEELRIEYVSPLAQAQKLSGAQGLISFFGMTRQIAEADPTVLDKVDLDQCVDELAAMTGVPARCVRSDKDVAEIREGRAKAKIQSEEAMMAMEMAKIGSAGVRNLAQSPMMGQTALDRLTQSQIGA